MQRRDRELVDALIHARAAWPTVTRSTDWTVAAADNLTDTRMTNAQAVVITIPASWDGDDPAEIRVRAQGTGAVSFFDASGTLEAFNGLYISGRGGLATLRYVDGEWFLFGDLSVGPDVPTANAYPVGRGNVVSGEILDTGPGVQTILPGAGAVGACYRMYVAWDTDDISETIRAEDWTLVPGTAIWTGTVGGAVFLRVWGSGEQLPKTGTTYTGPTITWEGDPRNIRYTCVRSINVDQISPVFDYSVGHNDTVDGTDPEWRVSAPENGMIELCAINDAGCTVDEPAGTDERADVEEAVSFPTVGVTDDFTRANGDVGSNYATIFGGGVWRVAANKAIIAPAGAFSTARYTAASFSPDQEAYCDLVALPSGWSLGFYLRISNSDTDAYNVRLTAGNWEIKKIVAGVETSLGGSTTTWTAGDKAYVSTVGSTISVWRYASGAWGFVGSVTDSSVTAAGDVAMYGGGTTYLDTGTAADANPIGGSWTQLGTTFVTTGLKRLSNVIRGIGASGGAEWNASSFAADQEAFCTINAIGAATAAEFFFLIVRGTNLVSGTAGCYTATLYGTAVAGVYDMKIEKLISGVWSQVGTTATGITVAAGDEFAFSAVDTTLKVYFNQTCIKTATDASISGAGTYCGVAVQGTGWTFTNFGAGDLGSGPLTVDNLGVGNAAAPVSQVGLEVADIQAESATVTGYTPGEVTLTGAFDGPDRSSILYAFALQSGGVGAGGAGGGVTDPGGGLGTPGGGVGNPNPTPTPAAGLQLGAATIEGNIVGAYGTSYHSKFRVGVQEYEGKWPDLEPTQGSFNWSNMDVWVDDLQANGMKGCWHTPCWYLPTYGIPNWVNSLPDNQVQARVEALISAVLGRYKTRNPGVITKVDIANEPFVDGTATYRSFKLTTALGYAADGIPNYIRIACDAAKAADSTVRRRINDYSVERSGQGVKRNALTALGVKLKSEGRLEGVGWQNHWDNLDIPGYGSETEANYGTAYAALCKPVTDAGLFLDFTECDVARNIGGSITTLAQQTEIWKIIGRAAKLAGVEWLVGWGHVHSDSWRGGSAEALLVNNDYTETAAYTYIKALTGSVPPPTPGVESADDTTITPGVGTIIDAAGRRITLSTAGEIFRDGVKLGINSSVVNVVYDQPNHRPVQTNNVGDSWYWNDGTSAWVSTSTPAPGPGPAPLPTGYMKGICKRVGSTADPLFNVELQKIKALGANWVRRDSPSKAESDAYLAQGINFLPVCYFETTSIQSYTLWAEATNEPYWPGRGETDTPEGVVQKYIPWAIAARAVNATVNRLFPVEVGLNSAWGQGTGCIDRIYTEANRLGYNAAAFNALFEAISMHLYDDRFSPLTAGTYATGAGPARADAARAAFIAHGKTDCKVVDTESGWSDTTTAYTLTPATIAQWDLDYETARKQRPWLLGRFRYFTFDSMAAGREKGFGLWYNNGSYTVWGFGAAKPAAQSIATNYAGSVT